MFSSILYNQAVEFLTLFDNQNGLLAKYQVGEEGAVLVSVTIRTELTGLLFTMEM